MDKKQNKSRKIFITLAVMLTVIMSVLGIVQLSLNGVFNRNSSNADASGSNYSYSYVLVGELISQNKGEWTYSESNLNLLLKYLTGNSSASVSENATETMSQLGYLADNTLSYYDLLEIEVGSKTYGQEIQVVFGGYKWIVVNLYKNSDGDVIATLWRTNGAYVVWQEYRLNLTLAALNAATETSNENVKNLAFASVATIGSQKVSADGGKITPSIVVNFNGETLTEDVDYVLTYQYNTSSSLSSVLIEPAVGSEYTGSLIVYYEIEADISGASVVFTDEVGTDADGVYTCEWTGNEFTPEIEVWYAGELLSLNEDYSLGYSNNTDVGTATIKITGMGAFEGTSKVATFVISKRSLTESGRITVGDIATQTYSGQALTPSVVVTDTSLENKVLKENEDYTLSFSNNTNAGTASVVISGLGSYTGSISKTFTILPLDLSNGEFTLNSSTFNYDGQGHTPTITYTLNNETLLQDTDYTLTYYYGTISDRNIVTDATETGTYYVVLKGVNNFTGSNSTTYTIVNVTINAEDVTLETDSLVYNKKAQVPNFTVMVNGNVLTENKDFTYTYLKDTTSGSETDAPINVGTYYLKIVGEGGYNGTVYVPFTITPASLTNGTLTLDEYEFTYSGSVVTPGIVSVITNEANKSLEVPESEYAVLYSNNEGAGTGIVTVEGVGNYTGSVSAYFTIANGEIGYVNIEYDTKSDTNITVEYSGEDISEAIVITVYDKQGNEISLGDYAIAYSTYDFVNAGKIEVTATATQNGDYMNYSGSATGTITITPLDVTDSATAWVTSAHTYNGQEHTPTVVVNYDSNTISNSNYTISYDQDVDRINAGTVKVYVNFKNNYAGTIETNFVIAQRSITHATCSVNDQIYTGSAIEPTTIIITDVLTSVVSLQQDVDYSIESWSNNVSVGKATITISGIGNYTGSKEIIFKITEKSLTECEIDFGSSYVYDGEEHKITPIVKNGDTILDLDTDYEVSYLTTDFVSAGTISVTVVGKGNFAGTIEGSYEITKRDLFDYVTIEVEGKYVYDGTEQKATFSVKDTGLGKTLTADSDYIVSYSNNINAGTNATIQLTGAGNYTGTITTTFTIVADEIATVTLSSYSSVYDGNEKEIVVLSVVTKNNLKLKTSEYEISCNPTELIDAGEYSITISGTTDNITGQATATYIIEKATISGMSLNSTTATYDGEEHIPVVANVWAGSLLLSENDYSLIYYRDNDETIDFTSAGTITVSVKASDSSNFKDGDTVSATFIISCLDISELYIEYYYKDSQNNENLLTDDGQTYVGYQVIPVVYADENKQIKLGKSDYSYVTLDADKNETKVFTNASTYTVVITGKGNYSGSVSKVYKVAAVTLVESKMEYSISNKVYTGSEIKLDENDIDLSIYVESIYGYEKLTFNTDFEFYVGYYNLAKSEAVTDDEYATLTDKTGVVYVEGYLNNTAVGTANVFFKGKNNFDSVICLPFKIVSATIENATINFISSEFEGIENNAYYVTYSGSAYTPSVSVSIGNIIIATTDYVVTYSDNLNQGTAKVKISGVNNYKGTVTAQFTIKAQDIAEVDKVKLASLTYNGESRTQTITLSYNGKILAEDKDYTFRYYRLGTDETYEPITDDYISAGNIRIVISGQGNFTGTTNLDYEILALSLTSSSVTKGGTVNASGQFVLDSSTYSGSEIKIIPTLAFNTSDLREGDDFTLSYLGDLTNVGEITIIATGIGNYKDCVEFVYSITKADISVDTRFTITYDNEAYFTGNAITIYVTIYDKITRTQLVESDSYTLTYYNNINVSYDIFNEVVEGASVVVAGTGNYSGSGTLTFKILPLDITNENVSVGIISDVDYDATEQKLAPIIQFGSTTLEENVDYELSYSEDLTNAGTVTVTITGKGNFSSSTTCSYQIKPLNLSGTTVILSQTSFTYTGSEITPSFTIYNPSLSACLSTIDYEAEYSNNLNVSYNDKKEVIADAYITISGLGNYTGSLSVSFMIVPISLLDENVTINYEKTFYYTGSKIELDDITILFGGSEFGEDEKTFSLSYSNNVEVGQATVTITGQVNFSGETTIYFTITQKIVEDDDFEIVLGDNETSFEFSGSAINPLVTIYFKGQAKILDAENYNVTYFNNIVVGTARVVVEFTKSYTGTIETTFKISAKDIDSELVLVSLTDTTITYDGAIHMLEPTLTFNDYTLTSSDYSYSYTHSIDDENFVDAQTVTIIIVGKGNFKNETRITYKIVAKSLNADDIIITINDSDIVYTGYEIKPEYSVRYGYYDLIAGEDFKASWSDNVVVGTATLTITALSSNFVEGSSKSIEFVINQKALTTNMITNFLNSVSYTGTEITQDFELKYNGKTLTLNEDYALQYSNNIESGVAKVVISAVEDGNFTGSIYQTFEILKLSISQAIADNLDNEYVFIGNEIKPIITLTIVGYYDEGGADLKTLILGSDYTIEYSADLINAGQKTIKITGQGNFEDTLTLTYTIAKVDLSASYISVDSQKFASSVNYNYGESITQDIVLYVGIDENLYVLNENYYSISYSDNTNVGVATITITPTNENLDNIATLTFTIEKIDPTITISDVYEGYVGDDFATLITLGLNDTLGGLSFETASTTILTGTTDYNYTFTPEDTQNYNTINGTITIKGIDVVVEYITAESSSYLVDGTVFDASKISVVAVYNDGHSENVTSFVTSVVNGETLEQGNNIVISYYDTTTQKTYECTLSVLRSTIANGLVTITGLNGFDSDIDLVVNEVVDEDEINNLLSSVYDDPGDVQKMYLISLQKSGVSYTQEGISVSFDVSQLEEDSYTFYLVKNGELIEIESSSEGSLNLGSDSEIILVISSTQAEKTKNYTLLIILLALVSSGLAVNVVVRVSVSRKKQRQKMSAYNEDLERYKRLKNKNDSNKK